MPSRPIPTVDAIAGTVLLSASILSVLGLALSLGTNGSPDGGLFLLAAVLAAVQGLLALALFAGVPAARPVAAGYLLLAAIPAYLSGALVVVAMYGGTVGLLIVGSLSP